MKNTMKRDFSLDYIDTIKDGEPMGITSYNTVEIREDNRTYLYGAIGKGKRRDFRRWAKETFCKGGQRLVGKFPYYQVEGEI